jgi:hypothetical protein
MAQQKSIQITNLLINPENYRFDSVASQKQAIDLMIRDQGEKIFVLAKHIVENGQNPTDIVQVTASNSDKSMYIVLEGNRRIVALKAINNPDIIDNKDDLALRNKFKKLHDDYKNNLPKEVLCIVYDTPSEADKWIKLKHAGQQDGVGTVSWDSQQIQRFEEKVEGKSSIALQTIKILNSSPDVPSDIKSNLKNLKTTNLDRLLSDPKVREFLGIDINKGIVQSKIAEKEVVKGLSHMVKDLLDPNFSVKKIYTKDDRDTYIKKFDKNSVPDKTKKATAPWQFNGNSTASKKSSKPKPNPSHRTKLIPNSCILSIKNQRVNAIYHELRSLDTVKYTNATAVLFRVFVELSLDCFLEENKMIVGSAAKSSLKLTEKVIKVASYLESKKLADPVVCKGIKLAVNNANSILGVDTWHAYVHNNKFTPSSQNLIDTWDGIQVFMEKLWENVK